MGLFDRLRERLIPGVKEKRVADDAEDYDAEYPDLQHNPENNPEFHSTDDPRDAEPPSEEPEPDVGDLPNDIPAGSDDKAELAEGVASEGGEG